MGRLSVLPDTSAWVEFARATEGPADLALLDLTMRGAEIIMTEPVVMEFLAGAASPERLQADRAMLLRHPLRPVGGLATYEHAAEIVRICRRRGEPIRRGIDCLIAAVAIREGVPVLHADRDFDVIARHTPLQVYPTDP